VGFFALLCSTVISELLHSWHFEFVDETRSLSATDHSHTQTNHYTGPVLLSLNFTWAVSS